MHTVKDAPSLWCTTDAPPPAAPPPGAPVQVDLSWQLLALSAVSAPEHTFSADLYVKAAWTDASLRGRAAADEGAGLWTPRLEVVNACGEIERVFEAFNVDPATGAVFVIARVRGTFSTAMDLRAFPFDSQTLRLEVEPTDDLTGQVEHCALRGERLHARGAAVPTGWTLTGVSSASRVKDVSMDDTHWSSFTLALQVTRQPGFYMWRVVLVVVALLLLTMTTFACAPDNIGDRLSVTMTLALTIVAFQLVVAEILPKVEYLTYLDKVFLSCFFGVVFVSLESAALHVLLVRAEAVDAATAAWWDAVVAGGFAVAASGVAAHVMYRHAAHQAAVRRLLDGGGGRGDADAGDQKKQK